MGENSALYKNYEKLTVKGQQKERIDALDIIESGIRRAVPYTETLKLLEVSKDRLRIGGREYLLSEIGNIYVVGVGKGSFPIAQALDEKLGSRIEKGLVVVKEGEKRRLSHIDVFESSHPIPDERSIVAAKEMVKILAEAKKGDIVFAAITGGSSAMANMPADPITIDELKALNVMLLKCGASIGKINAVRKHICQIKGGRLLEYAAPAKIITLTLNTAPPDMPWPDMCLPDPTTYQDAIEMLQEYRLWDQIAPSIRNRLEKGLRGEVSETVKSLDAFDCSLYSVADPRSCCEAAAKKAEELGYHTMLLSTTLEGEAKDLGIVLAGIATEAARFGRPVKTPCAIISGGETTVTINGTYGDGGPNQETALGFSTKWYLDVPVACASIDTDGTDGPCMIAGGIVDGLTKARAEKMGLSINNALNTHDASNALRLLEDEIITGHTGTNVMNLRVVVVGKGGESNR
ncbi:glycerate kinase type-2 family protein [Marasmitruncus massiliensis]|uniref:glycerate kinase type-2 family protein n=1 Tax=Marasmitruncus massiliensis TaxID=1944642 RepID=UPI000C7AA224|nr:DUF4147 domain-containing protein [Marasmitruncus massiliensis]